jgi:hypothetical protein
MGSPAAIDPAGQFEMALGLLFYFEGDQGYVFWMRALWENKANSGFSSEWFGAGRPFDSGRGPRKWTAGGDRKRFRTTL